MPYYMEFRPAVGTHGGYLPGYPVLIKTSKIPFTIVRATQFFEFVGGIAQFSTEVQRFGYHPLSCSPSRRMTSLRPCGCRNRRTIKRYGRASRSRTDQNG